MALGKKYLRWSYSDWELRIRKRAGDMREFQVDRSDGMKYLVCGQSDAQRIANGGKYRPTGRKWS